MDSLHDVDFDLIAGRPPLSTAVFPWLDAVGDGTLAARLTFCFCALHSSSFILPPRGFIDPRAPTPFFGRQADCLFSRLAGGIPVHWIQSQRTNDEPQQPDNSNASTPETLGAPTRSKPGRRQIKTPQHRTPVKSHRSKEPPVSSTVGERRARSWRIAGGTT